jgi:exopolysaccharide production protein ExoQ
MASSRAERSLILLNRDLTLYLVFTIGFGLLGAFSGGASFSSLQSSSGDMFTQVFWLIVIANSVLLVVLRKGRNLPGVLWVLGSLLPLILWITVSFCWSAFPDLTIRRAVREIIELVSIVLLISTYSHPTEPLRVLFLSFLSIMFVDLIFIPFPSHYLDGYVGVHGHKNSTGAFYLLALPLFVLAILDRRIARWPYTAIFASICAVGLLLLSKSKTAVGVCALTIICVVALGALRWMGQYKGVFAIIYALIAGASAIVVVAVGLDDTLTFLTGDPTLTGRVALWQYVLARWEENPYFGQGFGALWQVGSETEAYLRHSNVTGWMMNEAHNGYLDVLAQTGIIGILLLAIFLFCVLLTLLFAREEKSNPLNVWKWFGIYVAIGLLISNITESIFLRGGSTDWLLLVAVFTSAVVFRNSGREAREAHPVGERDRDLSAFSLHAASER